MQGHHEEYLDKILEAIDTKEQVLQRSLARDMGIALGLTNLLLRKLVVRGLVRVSKVKPQRIRYLLTPEGMAEKAKMSHRIMVRAADRFRLARTRLQETFCRVSADWPSETLHKPVVFYGTGELAEIGFVCLDQSDLSLVGVFDDVGRTRFFGVPVFPSSALAPQLIRDLGDARVIVMSTRERGLIAEELTAAGVPQRALFWS